MVAALLEERYGVRARFSQTSTLCIERAVGAGESRELIGQRGRVVPRPVAVQGLVAAVDGSQIILNVGGKAGVKVGDRLSVQRVSQEIKDPATGKVIRRLSSDVGIVRVTDVEDDSSVAEVESGSGFRISDSVRSVGQK